MFTPSKKVPGLPKSFDGDPDPRHRERLYSKWAETGPDPTTAEAEMIPASVLFEVAKGTTSELEKRCVYNLMNKPAKDRSGKPVKGARMKLSRAFAICRASLQKSGRIKKGKATLTKLGGRISGGKARKKDHGTKVAGFEKAVKAARKK